MSSKRYLPPPHAPTAPITHALKGHKPWRAASEAEKLLHSVKVAAALDGLSFTVNLSEKEEPSIASASDPCRTFARRLQRAFSVIGAPPFAFTVEVSPAGRTHIHGVLIPATGLARHHVVQALMKAGGKVTGRAAARQVSLREITDAGGWQRYIMADAERTREALDIKRVAYISDPLRKLVHDHW